MFRPAVIDLYHGDPVDSFALVKQAGVVGVIHKATQGVSIVDPRYVLRRRAALQAGLLWGAYHFATGEGVEEQVEHFLSVAQPNDKTLVALDFEANPTGSTMTISQAKQFLTLIREKLGRKAVIYSGNLIKATQAKADPYFAEHKLWLSEYGPHARLPASWTKYFLWQFTGDGIGPVPDGHHDHSIPGIPVKGLDISTYDGTPDELAAEWAS